MAEYIEREAAKSAIMWCEDENNFDFSQGLIAAEDTLDNIPAADVMPVVRCGDCEYNGHCFTQSFVRDEGIIPFDPDTWFCADGKRTDGKA